MRALVEAGYPTLGFDPAYGGEGDVGGAVASFQMLGYGDLSLMVKAGVQWGPSGRRLVSAVAHRVPPRWLDLVGPVDTAARDAIGSRFA